MDLFDIISNDIKAAMLSREKEKLEALRSVKAAFLLAKSEKESDLTEEKGIAIIQKLVKQRKEAADIYKANNRMELCDKELFELSVLEKYLPAKLSDEELTGMIKEIISKLGATNAKEMGKIIGIANKQLSGKADGKVIADKVKELLSAL
jgi:uncharacterized protein